MPKVHPKKIIKRSKMLRSLSNDKKNKFYNQNNGRLKNILIESYEEGLLSGLTENYIRVKAVGNINEVNTIIPFRMVYDKEGEMRGHRLT
jgi:threonylcarbamoyladenosine tRNA methylthiotransferase MtaB